jgi:signal transduction histidine kinase
MHSVAFSLNSSIPPLKTINLKEKDFIEVKIVDAGIGIAPEDYSKIFRRYFWNFHR